MPGRPQPSTLAALLAMVALLCAGLIPDGYMPGPTRTGGWGLVLCPDGGPALVSHTPRSPSAHTAEHGPTAAHGGRAPAQTDAAAHQAAGHGDHAQVAAKAAHPSGSASTAYVPGEPPLDNGSPCVWAAAAGETGQGGAAPSEPGQSLGRPVPRAEPGRPHLGPGGLAAPPPPSHAPPLKA